MHNVTELRPQEKSENGVNAPTPRNHERSKSQDIVATIFGSNLSNAKKIETIATLFDQIPSNNGNSNNNGANKHTIGQWITSALLAVFLAIDMFGGIFSQDNTEVLNQLDEIQITMAESNAAIDERFESINERFEVIESRLTNIEVSIATMSRTDEELSAALSDYIDAEGYKDADLPDSVRLVMLRNEQVKLENKRK